MIDDDLYFHLWIEHVMKTSEPRSFDPEIDAAEYEGAVRFEEVSER